MYLQETRYAISGRKVRANAPSVLGSLPARYWLPAAFWGSFALFSALSTWLAMLEHGHSLLRLVSFQLVVVSYWVAATPLIALLARRFPLSPFRASAAAAHLASGLAVAAGSATWFLAMSVVLRPYDSRGMDTFLPNFPDVLRMKAPFELLIYCGTVGALYALDFRRRSQERAVRAAELERELALARLETLSSQVNPHFLFNALNTVSALVREEDGQAAVRTVAALSDILRYALDSGGEQKTRLGEELEVVARYLEIERMRYGERFRVTIDAGEGVLAARAPRFLLLPLVENAVRHGAAAATGEAWLEVRGSRCGERLVLEVANSCPSGRSRESGLGVGLAANRARLQQIYGEDQRMEAGRGHGRFDVRIEIPWETES